MMKMNRLYTLLIGGLAVLAMACEPTPEAPVITDIDPVFGETTTLVTLEGMHLANITELAFNGQAVNFNTAYNSDVALLFRVPENLETGEYEIAVTTAGGTASTSFRITLAAPEIYNVMPESAPVGATVEINGKNFFEPLSVFFFDNIPADIVSRAPDKVKVVVPDGTQEGPILLSANGGDTLSPVNFFLTDEILINDFDGNGVRAATEDWIRSGFVDQQSAAEAVQNSNPDPIDGNYLHISGTDALAIEWVGGFENPSNDPDFDVFAITAEERSKVLLTFDINTNGRTDTHLLLALKERDGSNNDFAHNVAVTGEGWHELAIPLTRFEDLAGNQVDLAKIKTLKLHLIDTNETGNPLEANIDNVRFVQIF